MINMENSVDYLVAHHLKAIGEKLTPQKTAAFQKRLSNNGFPQLPDQFVEFLKFFNGVRCDETVILGIDTTDEYSDLLSINRRINERENSLILAYDEFAFLVYDASQKGYFLIDRDSGENLEEFYEDELDLALIGMIHLDDD